MCVVVLPLVLDVCACVCVRVGEMCVQTRARGAFPLSEGVEPRRVLGSFDVVPLASCVCLQRENERGAIRLLRLILCMTPLVSLTHFTPATPNG